MDYCRTFIRAVESKKLWRPCTVQSKRRKGESCTGSLIADPAGSSSRRLKLKLFMIITNNRLSQRIDQPSEPRRSTTFSLLLCMAVAQDKAPDAFHSLRPSGQCCLDPSGSPIPLSRPPPGSKYHTQHRLSKHPSFGTLVRDILLLDVLSVAGHVT
jgi:hypothetical protein